jgi:hypothetical protein
MHNWALFSELLKQLGTLPMMLGIYTLLLVVGIVKLFRSNVAVALLLVIPVTGLLVASANNQFSLMPRVTLFSLPIFIVLIGVGFDAILSIDVREWKLAMVALGIYCIAGNIAKSTAEPYKYEELTEGLNFAHKLSIRPDDTYIYWAGEPALIYYTQIHPWRSKWQYFREAIILGSGTYYPLLGSVLQNRQPADKPVALIFTNATYSQSATHAEQVRRYVPETMRYEKDYVKVFIYQNK